MDKKENYVFISYSSENQQMADSVRSLLLENGVSCWMAPYDIPAGSNYAAVLNDAIQQCSCFLLLLTNAAQNSQHVVRELELAVRYKRNILPLQLEKLELNASFQYYLAINQIVEAPELRADAPAFQQVLSRIQSFAEPSKEVKLSAPDEPMRSGGNHLMPDPIPNKWLFDEKKGEDYPVLGNRSLLRKSVRSVTFVDSLAHKGTDAWDVSAAQDGTVWAWTAPAEDKLVDLYIGANGRILAPGNSKNLLSDYTNAERMVLSCLDTANVTDMGWMFRGCSSLTTLDVSSFNTANVTSMNGMFYGCRSLTSLDVSNFNTTNVTDMGWMFDRCRSLTSLDLSHFNTASVTDMSEMFWGCSSLTRRGVKLPASKRDAERLRKQLLKR